MNKKQLMDLKEQIDSTKSQISSLKGKQEYLMQQLEQEWNCSTLKQAEQKAKEMQADIDKLESQIEQGVNELEEKYFNGTYRT